MPHCRHCHTDKPAVDFYDYAPRKCKGCFHKYRQWYEKTFPEKISDKHKRKYRRHRDRYLARDRARPRRYKRTEEQIETLKEWRRTHRLEWNVKAKVRYAVKSGVLVRPTKCEKCDYECTPQAHHEDYAKPLEVVWLCASCHKRRHKEMDALGIKPLNGTP